MWETIIKNDHHSQVGGAVEFLRVGRRHEQLLGWRSLFEVFLWYLEFCELSTRKRAKNIETSWRVISRHQTIKLLSSRIGTNHQSSSSLSSVNCETEEEASTEVTTTEPATTEPERYIWQGLRCSMEVRFSVVLECYKDVLNLFLSISMSYNVISCRKVAENTQILNIAKFAI